jgi:hypothetical protein
MVVVRSAVLARGCFSSRTTQCQTTIVNKTDPNYIQLDHSVDTATGGKKPMVLAIYLSDLSELRANYSVPQILLVGSE